VFDWQLVALALVQWTVAAHHFGIEHAVTSQINRLDLRTDVGGLRDLWLSGCRVAACRGDTRQNGGEKGAKRPYGDALDTHCLSPSGKAAVFQDDAGFY
jgi:hypothetical protein